MTRSPVGAFMAGCACEVFLVRHLLQPIDVPAVERFLDRDVRHRRRGSRAMPVFVRRRAPDDITGADLNDRFPLALGPAAPGGHDEGLSKRMAMPGRTRPRFEGDAGAGDAGRRGCDVQRIDAHGAGEEIRGTFGGGLRTTAFEMHGVNLHGNTIDRGAMLKRAWVPDKLPQCAWTIE